MIYDSSVPTVRQTDSWSCSVASVCWALRSLGLDADYPALEQSELAVGLVSRDLGLLDGSGGALAQWLCTTYGLSAAHVPIANWEWLQAVAGTMPIIAGGHGWNHWVGVRSANGYLQLANPADGWMGVHQVMTVADFRRLGPFSAVYVTVDAPSEEDDPVKVAELENTIDYLKGDVADAFEAAITTLEQTPRLPQAARDAVTGGLRPALATLRRGSPPEDGD